MVKLFYEIWEILLRFYEKLRNMISFLTSH